MGIVGELWDFLSTGSNWSGSNGIWARTQAHAWISLVSVLLAAVIAIPAAVVLAHRRLFPVISVAMVNIGRAVPSFAIVALVLPFSIRYGFGLGFWPTTVALVALAVPPIFTNTYAGIAGTPPELVEAATGIGMTGRDLLARVELPVALPLVLTGLRISVVQVIATATLGALVGYQCLGSFILEGLAQPTRARERLIGGAALVTAMAVAAELALSRLEPRLLPWSRRLR
jgi:osmoprotectant transport system permease protein